jgi:hypothetical protein
LDHVIHSFLRGTSSCCKTVYHTSVCAFFAHWPPEVEEPGLLRLNPFKVSYLGGSEVIFVGSRVAYRGSFAALYRGGFEKWFGFRVLQDLFGRYAPHLPLLSRE